MEKLQLGAIIAYPLFLLAAYVLSLIETIFTSMMAHATN
jgi:hypothetical protein